MEFKGTYTAMVTPFKNGDVDFDAFSSLLDIQQSAEVTGVVPCGCTGEAATLTRQERHKLLEKALARVGDRVQVIPGTGTNATENTIAYTKEAEATGAHAAMLITPYYNKPSQQGLLDHYRRVGDATKIPLILYNVPGRTGVTLSPDTIAQLHATGRYAAIKEAGGSMDAFSNIRAASDIAVLSGDDALTVPMIALGARGVVSVISNLIPGMVREMVDCALEGETKRSSDLHFRLLPLMRAAFVESNPSPIKAMLAARGLIENELRPPLAPVGDDSMKTIRDVLDLLGKVRSGWM
jgi:4-hydroxy-tetrahydrodipicolinate synthase